MGIAGRVLVRGRPGDVGQARAFRNRRWQVVGSIPFVRVNVDNLAAKLVRVRLELAGQGWPIHTALPGRLLTRLAPEQDVFGDIEAAQAPQHARLLLRIEGASLGRGRFIEYANRSLKIRQAGENGFQSRLSAPA